MPIADVTLTGLFLQTSQPPASTGNEKQSVSSLSAGGGRSRSGSTTQRIRNSFHIGHHRQKSDPAAGIPELPQIKQGSGVDEQAQWEHRATLLAKGVGGLSLGSQQELKPPSSGRSRANTAVSVKVEHDVSPIYFHMLLVLHPLPHIGAAGN